MATKKPGRKWKSTLSMTCYPPRKSIRSFKVGFRHKQYRFLMTRPKCNAAVVVRSSVKRGLHTRPLVNIKSTIACVKVVENGHAARSICYRRKNAAIPCVNIEEEETNGKS